VTDISGTFIYTSGTNTTNTITGLDSNFAGTYILRRDGSSSSAILVNSLGISFVHQGVDPINGPFVGTATISNSTSGSNFAAVDEIDSQELFGSQPKLIESSTLIPASVPGPLPLMGTAAAFGWSRRLRRRVGSSTGRPGA